MKRNCRRPGLLREIFVSTFSVSLKRETYRCNHSTFFAFCFLFLRVLFPSPFLPPDFLKEWRFFPAKGLESTYLGYTALSKCLLRGVFLSQVYVIRELFRVLFDACWYFFLSPFNFLRLRDVKWGILLHVKRGWGKKCPYLCCCVVVRVCSKYSCHGVCFFPFFLHGWRWHCAVPCVLNRSWQKMGFDWWLWGRDLISKRLGVFKVRLFHLMLSSKLEIPISLLFVLSPFLESHTVRRCLILSGGRCCPSGLWFKKALVERVDISFRLKTLLEFRIQGKGFCPELSEFAQSFQPNPCDKCNIKAAALDCEVVQ